MGRSAIALPAVKVGQVWKDNDPRHKEERLLRVAGVDSEFAYLEPASPGAKMRSSRIALKRFRPTSNGYVLVSDVAQIPAPSGERADTPDVQTKGGLAK